MNHIDIIDEHLIIRETVGYEILNQVPIEDMPKVMEFLKILYNYNRMKRVAKEEPAWVDPIMEMLDKEEEMYKESKKARELTREEVESINSGEVFGMATYKGKLEWDPTTKYILIYSTGSLVRTGSIHETMEEILRNHNMEWAIK